MRSIDRSRSVDAISAAQSWKRNCEPPKSRFVILWTAKYSWFCEPPKSRTKRKNQWVHWFLTNILSFSTKKCLQPSYFGCPKINCDKTFSRTSSWGFNLISSSCVSGTYVWLFIELSEQILIFSFFSFFWWFWWEIIEEPCISWKTTVWTKKYMVSQTFSHQNHQKKEKKNLLRQFYKQSYYRAGNEKETESITNAWTDPY